MTVDQALTVLRELRALERLQRAVQERPAPSFEWQCGLGAIDDRIRLLQYGLSQQDQAVLDAVQVRYDQERLELLESVASVAVQGLDQPPDQTHRIVIH